MNVRKASGDVAFHVRQSSRRAILLSVTFLACPFATWAQGITAEGAWVTGRVETVGSERSDGPRANSG